MKRRRVGPCNSVGPISKSVDCENQPHHTAKWSTSSSLMQHQMNSSRASTASSRAPTPTTYRPPALPTACVFPSALASEGVGGILYKNPQASSPTKHFQRKPPHLDFAREYKVANRSYHDARATLDTLAKRHRTQQIAKEEAFNCDVNANKFTTSFVENRLGTCGVPTLNTMSVIIDRQRRKEAARTNQFGSSTRILKPTTSDQIRDAVRRAYGSQTLDLKALELIHIPSNEVFMTMLMQLARMIRCVNVSHNALRELPVEFCDAFPEAEVLIYKENALDSVPESLAKLQYLKSLNVECNQILRLPMHLPSSLEVLIASRNRLAQLTNLHELSKLLELDLSHNHFQVLPNGMMFLSKLKKLSLNGNRLITLALPPKLVQDTEAKKKQGGEDQALLLSQSFESETEVLMDPEEAKKLWRVETDPRTQESVYFHLRTKQVTRAKPKCFQIHIPRLQLNKNSAPQSVPQHIDQKAAIADFPGGWEIRLCEGTSTQLTFVNHVTSESFTTIPSTLDRLGDLSYLQTLSISGNQLLELPPSIGKLVRLKRLEAEHNKIMTLPDTLRDMQALQVVKFGMNALSWLPASFMKLANLTDLDLKLNRFQLLPEDFGDLVRLQTLDLSANALENLPKSFLKLEKLSTVKLQNNPQLTRKPGGGFRPETLATGDIEQVMWQLTHQLQCELRGAQPPVPESRIVGVGDECWSTDIHLHKEFSQAIAMASSSETKALDFHWKNLSIAQFPPSFYSTLSNLHELRLSGHNLEVVPSAFSCLKSLRVLQLRKNKIREIADDIFDFGDSRNSSGSDLLELDLEYNQLESLPTSIGNLTKLLVLKVSNNRLTAVPESIRSLSSALKEVHLTHNRFLQAPSSFTSLLSLEKLDMSYNRLESLDAMDFANLQQLRSLRVNVNQLTTLPDSLGETLLQELWMAGNKFVDFPPAILQLKPTLTCLRMQSNKLYKLPVEFGELFRLDDVQSDGNPFKSPPPEVMNLGIRCIREYLLKRQQRIQEIGALLTANRVAYDANCFQELKVRKLLVQHSSSSDTEPEDEHNSVNLKFLTRQHLAAFDLAIDEYVNGMFYLFDVRGADLLNDLLLKTQFTLAQRHHEQVLDDLLKLCRLIKAKKWADKVDFRYDCDRPWGLNGEDVGVFMLNPSIIFEDQLENESSGSMAVKVPSILSVIKMRVRHGFEHEAFTRSQKDVQDAIENYVGIFGPIGVVHDNVPFKCGCEDLLRFNKMHEPCFKPGWTFLQVIYTQEEAERRQQDEDKIAEALAALRPQIETFLKTTEGEKRFHREVHEIKSKLRKELKELKRKLEKTKKKYKARAKAVEKELKAEQKLLKKDPHAAAESVADVKAREKEQEEVKKLDERIKTWQKEYDEGSQRLGFGFSAFLDAVVTKLLEKVGTQVKNHLIQQQRQKAIEFGWRRPWDGRNGREFEKYKLLVLRKMLDDGSMEREDKPPPASGEPLEPAGESGEAEADEDALSDNSEISDVSFEGYEDLVRNANSMNPGLLAGNGDDEDDDDDDNDEEGDGAEDREAALANLVVSDVSDDELNEDDKNAESEDSDI